MYVHLTNSFNYFCLLISWRGGWDDQVFDCQSEGRTAVPLNELQRPPFEMCAQFLWDAQRLIVTDTTVCTVLRSASEMSLNMCAAPTSTWHTGSLLNDHTLCVAPVVIDSLYAFTSNMPSDGPQQAMSGRRSALFSLHCGHQNVHRWRKKREDQPSANRHAIAVDDYRVVETVARTGCLIST